MNRRTFLASALFPLGTSPVRWLSADLDGRIDATCWPDALRPIPLGSLLKPFLALAYLETHSTSPEWTCRGCWLPSGHGRQNLAHALANSCNSYFLRLAEDVNRAALDHIALEYGLALLPRSSGLERLVGFYGAWPQTPENVLNAFAALVRNGGLRSVASVLEGMKLSASQGTARAIGISCYAKTGTAACSHSPAAQGDGYVTAIFPPVKPRRLLLLQAHNTTGAHAAALAGGLLRQSGE